MGLTTGARLGPYEIQSAIGAGGMGEVYGARDAKLGRGRDVAITILPRLFVTEPERLARFDWQWPASAPARFSSLGHKSIAMTVRYSHFAPDYMMDAVEKLVPPSAKPKRRKRTDTTT